MAKRIGGKAREGDLTPRQVFARRLVELRKRHGWSQAQLAHRLAELGHPISRVSLAKIEKGARIDAKGARNVTLDEALAIAAALDVSPLYMFVPLEPYKPRVIILGGVQPVEPFEARRWLKGEEPLDLVQNPMIFFTERPAEEIAVALRAGGMGSGALVLANALRAGSAQEKEER